MVINASYVQATLAAEGTLLTVDDDGSGKLIRRYEEEGYMLLEDEVADELGGPTMYRKAEMRGFEVTIQKQRLKSEGEQAERAK